MVGLRMCLMLTLWVQAGGSEPGARQSEHPWDDEYLPLPISRKRPRLPPPTAPRAEQQTSEAQHSSKHPGVDIPLAGQDVTHAGCLSRALPQG